MKRSTFRNDADNIVSEIVQGISVTPKRPAAVRNIEDRELDRLLETLDDTLEPVNMAELDSQEHLPDKENSLPPKVWVKIAICFFNYCNF